ncbi:hypothetical protein [Phenylobacterium sp.]|jgi:hypothetical protein|uniref:hypothetical protein n=1 Tax=Phenylobacterium sp. TaxID=1871053 RepID=UPI0035AEE060
MNITKTAAGIVIAGLMLTGAAAAPAYAQTPPATASALEGKLVRGQKGVVLGVVERVILRPNGTPAQVLVRPKGPPTAGPRSIAYAALKLEGDSLIAPLTQAEFNAMPPVAVD